MSGLGWAVGVGIALLAVAAVSSGGSTSTAKGGDTSTRFTIKRNVIDSSLALPLSAFSKDDVLGVTLHDGKNNTDIPFLVKVNAIAKDGVDTIYTGISTVLGLDPGTHFVVYPRDVLSRVPSVGTPSETPLEHVLDAGDVAMGPAAFAALTGFPGIDGITDFELFNKGTFEDSLATAADAGQPGIYVTGSIPLLTYRRVSPWTVGTKALVKKQPIATTVATPISMIVAGDGFGRGGRYGGEFGRPKSNVLYMRGH